MYNSRCRFYKYMIVFSPVIIHGHVLLVGNKDKKFDKKKIAALRLLQSSTSRESQQQRPARSGAAPTMPSPHVPDPAAGTSHALPSAASIPPSRSNRSISFRIHPTVVANVFAHYTRVMNQDACCGDKSSSGATAAQPPRIFGCLIGVQHIQKGISTTASSSWSTPSPEPSTVPSSRSSKSAVS